MWNNFTVDDDLYRERSSCVGDLVESILASNAEDVVSRKDKGLSLVYTSTDDLPGQSVTVEGVRLLYDKMSSDLGLKMKLKI